MFFVGIFGQSPSLDVDMELCTRAQSALYIQHNHEKCKKMIPTRSQKFTMTHAALFFRADSLVFILAESPRQMHLSRFVDAMLLS
jgi:hypothetical protein